MDKPFAAMYHPYLFQNGFLCICVSLKKTIQAQMGQKKKKKEDDLKRNHIRDCEGNKLKRLLIR